MCLRMFFCVSVVNLCVFVDILHIFVVIVHPLVIVEHILSFYSALSCQLCISLADFTSSWLISLLWSFFFLVFVVVSRLSVDILCLSVVVLCLFSCFAPHSAGFVSILSQVAPVCRHFASLCGGFVDLYSQFVSFSVTFCR